MRTTLFLLVACVCCAGGAQPTLAQVRLPVQVHAGPPQRAFRTLALTSPTPRPAARFGQSTSAADWDADGNSDLIVGAPGEGAVYLFRGAGSRAAFGQPVALDAQGPRPGGALPADDRLGEDVLGADLDGDGRAEWIVGAPHTTAHSTAQAGACIVYGLEPSGTTPTVFLGTSSEPEHLGTSVTVGDYDDDGVLDIAVSAVEAQVGGFVKGGAVYVFFAPGPNGSSSILRFENPRPVDDAFFGLHLATGDLNGDSRDDLVVSGVWNTSSQGVELAGQVYTYPGPIDPLVYRVVEDDLPDPIDFPRYGMHLDADRSWLIVGAPRKDHMGQHDSGLAYSYTGLGFQPFWHHRPPGVRPIELTGFRVALADLYGDARPERVVATLAPPGPQGPRRAIWIWPGEDPSASPRRLLPITGAGSHWPMGLSTGPLAAGERESLFVGDPTFDTPGQSVNDDRGRVVVYY